MLSLKKFKNKIIKIKQKKIYIMIFIVNTINRNTLSSFTLVFIFLMILAVLIIVGKEKSP